MGIYEAAKDALKVAQKADNIELVQKLLDVQKMALDMQEKQQLLQGHIGELDKEIETLKTTKKLEFAEQGWMFDPDRPELRFCPVCANRDNFLRPVKRQGAYEAFCGTCDWRV